MNCKKCKARVDDFDVYCLQCGNPTNMVKNKLSAIGFFFKEYGQYKANYKTTYYILPFLLGVLPIAVIIWLMTQTNIIPGYWTNYFTTNALLTLFVPFLLVPFAHEDYSRLSMLDYLKELKNYGRFFLLALFMVLYFMFFRLICQGDPILNLVRLVMVFYGLAIVMPVPYLMIKKDMSVISALKTAYHTGKHGTRWQHFFLTALLLVLNGLPLLVAYVISVFKFYNDSLTMLVPIVAVLVGVFGLKYTLHFTYDCIMKYTKKLDDFDQLNPERQKPA